jgi:CO/xanthine dehydrogenase FAD-binding subunit
LSFILVLFVFDAEAVLVETGEAVPISGLISASVPSLSASLPLVASFRIKYEEKRLCAYARWSRTENDISILCAAVSLVAEEVEDRGEAGYVLTGSPYRVVKASSIRFALGGVAKTVVRLSECETFLGKGKFPSRAEIEREISLHISPIGDQRGGGRFKRRIASVLRSEGFMRITGGSWPIPWGGRDGIDDGWDLPPYGVGIAGLGKGDGL